MFAEYYAWCMTAMCSSSYAPGLTYSQSSMEIMDGMAAQAAQSHAADEITPADEEGESVSGKTFFLEVYEEEEDLVFIGQLVDANHPLDNIEQQHRDQLPRSFGSQGYRYP